MIEKEVLIELYLTQNLSQRKVAEKLKCSQTNIRHFLRKYDIKRSKAIPSPKKLCPKCNKIKDRVEFYKRSKSGNPNVVTAWCKRCTIDNCTKSRRDLKVKAIEYKGKACLNCGYDKCVDALEFHHKNPDEKDFSISTKGYTMSWKRAKAELDKCILVCSNCHREIHAKLRSK